MQFEKLFQLLARDDVKELALQAERPACVLVGESYAPVLKRALSEDEVIRALVEAGGRDQVMGLVDAARRWEFEHPTLGRILVSAGYHAGLLQARLKRPEGAAPLVDLKPSPKPLDAPEASEVGAAVASHAESSERVLSEPLPENPSELFELLLRLVRERRASDLHVLADRAPTLRIGGDLVKVGPVLPAARVEAMLLAQVPERLRDELARDGACDFALAHPRFGRFRTNVSRQRTGMKLSARAIGDRVQTLEELGLPASIAGATHHHQGLIVVAGPTGHGKTTTLAAIVDLINRERTDHIITVEDPIEYVHSRKRAVISQREVGTHTLSFASALKGSLREDPDVIAVGELRDAATVRMALSASETGHLVVSTMNTPSAAKAIERLIDLFPPGDQPQVRMSLSGGLRMIISQRLVPSADRKSVRPAVELLPGSQALWALIRDNKTFQIPSLQQRGKALGIVRLDDSLADLVRSGHTSLEIAKEYAEGPDQLEGLVRGVPARALEQAAPDNDTGREAAAAAQKFGKDMLSKAGRLFGGEK